ncbi:GNAT family N-acetyltransferase [Microbispora bryophytorum]|uniref:GNAT family N-acetyltransferase n=1 Tax=Microbispora bryophytorum TaxID=1460882 RepID=UPI003401CDC4
MVDWRLRPASTADVEAVAELRAVVLRPAEGAYWLEHFYLTPELQGRGVGSAVLGRLLDRCDREGALIRLNVLQGSPARRLYERHGFTVETEAEVDVFMVRDPAPAGS